MNRKLIIKVIVIGIFSLFIVLVFMPYTFAGYPTLEKTIYVDDDNIEGPWDGTQEHPYQFIQDGIDNASDGDTVFVKSGIYIESIKIDKSIFLHGENKNTTIIDGNNTKGKVVYISASNGATIKEFKIQNGTIGIGIAHENVHSENNIISNNIIQNNRWEGINVHCSKNNIISDNIIILNDEEGIDICSSSDNSKVDGNTISYNGLDGINVASNNIIIKENEIYENDNDGIHLFYADHIEISNNYIHSNKIHGIELEALMMLGVISDHVIEWNYIADNSYCGIIISGGPIVNTKIRHNHIESNGRSGVELFHLVIMSHISQNNLIDNDRNAWIVTSFFNIWTRNYWDDWMGFGPKIIKGDFFGSPLNNFDWHPAKEPYDIPIPEVP